MAAIFIMLAYVVGAIPSGYISTKLFRKLDVTKVGTGNVGTMNTLVNVGVLPGMVTLVMDLSKTFFILYLSSRWFNHDAFMMAGVFMVVLGHNYSIFLKFKGGKGLASLAALFFWFSPIINIYMIGIYLVFFGFFKSVNICTILTLLFLPLIFYRHESNLTYLVGGISLSLIAISKHIKLMLKQMRSDVSVGFEEEMRYE